MLNVAGRILEKENGKMALSMNTKTALLRIRERIPPQARDIFVQKVNDGLRVIVESDRIWHYALLGGVCGFLIDALPGSGFISDDWVTIGVALGAWVGYAKDRKEQKRRQEIRDVVEDALREAMATV